MLEGQNTLSESTANAVRITCLYNSGSKHFDALSTSDLDNLIRTTAVQVEQEICQWLKEEVPNPLIFPLSCSENAEDIKTTINRICTFWDYSVMAASIATTSFSTTELMSEVDRWICERGLQGNGVVNFAGLPINLCPTEAPIPTKLPITPPTKSTGRPRGRRETTDLFQVIES